MDSKPERVGISLDGKTMGFYVARPNKEG